MKQLFFLMFTFFLFPMCNNKIEKPCDDRFALVDEGGTPVCECPVGTILVDKTMCYTLRKGQYWGYKKDSGLPSDTIVLRYLSTDTFPANPGEDFNIHFSLYDTKLSMFHGPRGGRYYPQLQDSFYMNRDARRTPYFDHVAESTISGRFLNNGKQMKLVFHFMDYYDYTPIGDCEFLLNRVD